MRQGAVEEGHLLKAPVDGLEVEVDGLEDVGVGPEGDRRAGAVGGLALLQRARLGVGVVLPPHGAGLVDLDEHLGGERVHHGDADAVQTAGDRVRLAVELATRVQHRSARPRHPAS